MPAVNLWRNFYKYDRSHIKFVNIFEAFSY